MQLPPGDAHHAPARRLEAPIAGAVGFEGVGCVVVHAAVELDDEARGRPGAVDLDSVDENVGLRQLKTGIDEECLKALFELALDYAQAALCLFNDGFDDRDARLARSVQWSGGPVPTLASGERVS